MRKFHSKKIVDVVFDVYVEINHLNNEQLPVNDITPFPSRLSLS